MLDLLETDPTTEVIWKNNCNAYFKIDFKPWSLNIKRWRINQVFK